MYIFAEAFRFDVSLGDVLILGGLVVTGVVAFINMKATIRSLEAQTKDLRHERREMAKQQASDRQEFLKAIRSVSKTSIANEARISHIERQTEK